MASNRAIGALPKHPLPGDLPDNAGWRLRVDGLVEEPISLGLPQVVGLARASADGEFACEEGWFVPDLHWEGVTIAAVLQRARPRPDARWLRVGAGAFTVALPLTEALTGGLLAYRLNGAPLPREHGAPLRLIAPGRACFYSVKWVDRLDLLADEAETTGEAIARARISRAG